MDAPVHPHLHVGVPRIVKDNAAPMKCLDLDFNPHVPSAKGSDQPVEPRCSISSHVPAPASGPRSGDDPNFQHASATDILQQVHQRLSLPDLGQVRLVDGDRGDTINPASKNPPPAPTPLIPAHLVQVQHPAPVALPGLISLRSPRAPGR